MLINFFYTLRAAKLKVSVKEYLTLLEGLKEGVIDNSVDQFYYFARTALVKDEAQFDKFDRAFAAYFKGVEMLTDFTQDVPLEWLRKTLELELSPEEKAAIEKAGLAPAVPPQPVLRLAHEPGVRLRYEVRREFAPYVGVVWTRKFFGTADQARAAGEDVAGTRLAVGLRTWF